LTTEHARASEVEIRFTPVGPSRTRVELVHRNLDRHGDGWEDMRDSVGSPRGWIAILQCFVPEAGRS
jgi:hypothetical protein